MGYISEIWTEINQSQSHPEKYNQSFGQMKPYGWKQFFMQLHAVLWLICIQPELRLQVPAALGESECVTVSWGEIIMFPRWILATSKDQLKEKNHKNCKPNSNNNK